MNPKVTLLPLLTRSLSSSLCMELTPAMKGVGVFNTSRRGEGRIGMYTYL